MGKRWAEGHKTFYKYVFHISTFQTQTHCIFSKMQLTQGWSFLSVSWALWGKCSTDSPCPCYQILCWYYTSEGPPPRSEKYEDLMWDCILFQDTALVSLPTLPWRLIYLSSSVSTSLTGSWMCYMTSGTRWFPAGREALPSLRYGKHAANADALYSFPLKTIRTSR